MCGCARRSLTVAALHPRAAADGRSEGSAEAQGCCWGREVKAKAKECTPPLPPAAGLLGRKVGREPGATVRPRR